jgi:hypothetical protein
MTLSAEISSSFLCGGSLPRLPNSTLCDGYPDCPHGEDELNCVEDVQVGREDKWRQLKHEHPGIEMNVWNPMIKPDSSLKQTYIQKRKENLDQYQQETKIKDPLVVNSFNPFDVLREKQK